MLDVKVEEWVGLYERGLKPERINMLWGDAKEMMKLNKKMFEFFSRGGKRGGVGRQGVFLETLVTVYYLDHHLLSVVVI